MASGGGSEGIMLTALAGAAGFAAGGPIGAAAAMSATGSLYAGYQGMQAAKMEEGQLEIERDKERLQARQRAVAINEELARTLGEQQALLAARGISGQGTPMAIQRTSIANANLDLNVNAANLGSTLRSLSLARQQLKLKGQASLLGGVTDAASTGLAAYGQMKSLGGPSGSASMYSGGTGTNRYTGLRYGGV